LDNSARLPWHVVQHRFGADIVDVDGVIVATCSHWARAELIVFVMNTAADEPAPDDRYGVVLGLEATGPDWIAEGPVS
jgi:hypothetical protein